MDLSLIAPCGMNCAICRAYLRDKKKCPGCNGGDINKSASCLKCKIKNCEKLKEGKLEFCYECNEFPCPRIEQIDKRYITKYLMSMIDNLEQIKNLGMETFLEDEKVKWTCKSCGGIICVHKGACINCMKMNDFTKSAILKDFQKIPGVGKSSSLDLYNLGYRSIAELKDLDPEEMYEKICVYQGMHVDRCMLYVFRCAVYYAANDIHDPELLKWWNWKDGDIK